MAVEATYTKDIHYSGIITVDGETVVSMDANMDAKHPDVPIINRYINNGRKYRANKKDIDDVVDKFENDIWDEYDKYTAELEEKEKTEQGRKRFFFCVQMVEIAEKFVKTVVCREMLIPVTKVVFTELAGGITEWLEKFCNGRVFGHEAFFRTGEANFTEACAED